MRKRSRKGQEPVSACSSVLFSIHGFVISYGSFVLLIGSQANGTVPLLKAALA